MKEAYFIAGPNGSGKTSVIVASLPKDIPYINADHITKQAQTADPDLKVSLEQDLAAMGLAMSRVEEAISKGQSFAYETVMSHPSKLEFMQRATDCGFDTFLHFISTNSYEINIARVAERVANGGHDVPENKVRERWSRAISLLPGAITSVNEAYIFDSTEKTRLVLEVHKEYQLTYVHGNIPSWLARAAIALKQEGHTMITADNVSAKNALEARRSIEGLGLSARYR